MGEEEGSGVQKPALGEQPLGAVWPQTDKAPAGCSRWLSNCGRLWEVPQDSKAPLIPAWGLGTGTQGTAALSLLVSASLRCLPPGALDPRPP